jgi:PKD repeat protein
MQMIRSAALALCLAASPLAAQVCPIKAPSFILLQSIPATASEGDSVLLRLMTVIRDCPAPPPDQPYTCDAGGYSIQSCDTLQWTFGDGAAETLIGSSAVTHTYTHPGLYEVKLHIANALGSHDLTGSVYVASNPRTVFNAPRFVDVNEAAGSVTVHVTRSGDLSHTNRVNWRLAADANVMSDAQGMLTFGPGDADQVLTFPITPDHRYASKYYSFLYLDLVADGAIGDPLEWDPLRMQPTITVHDVDAVPVGTIADVSVKKGDSVARVPVDLSGSFAFPCCRGFVNWHAVDGTARDGVDYVGPQYFQSVSIQPGTTRAFIEIPLKDNQQRGTRSFEVVIEFAPFPLTVSRATVTIVDDSTPRRRAAR